MIGSLSVLMAALVLKFLFLVFECGDLGGMASSSRPRLAANPMEECGRRDWPGLRSCENESGTSLGGSGIVSSSQRKPSSPNKESLLSGLPLTTKS